METIKRDDKLALLIWGAGNNGKKLMETVRRNDYLEVYGFGDNDDSKIGKECNGVRIYGMKELKEKQSSFDCIVISIIKAPSLVYELLIKEFEKPVYQNISELMEKRYSIDIAGWCNARCKYCYTGRKNLEGRMHAEYMSCADFKRIHGHLKSIGLLHSFQDIMLYSWGEPLLNPDYLRILDYMESEGQNFSVSTNASTLKFTTNPRAYRNCNTVIFSLSGITQKTYEKIHGFDIHIIKNNIHELLTNMRENGFEGEAKVSFHVYKFNRNEIEEARCFAEENGLKFEPITAYLNSWSLQQRYLKEELSLEETAEINRELYIEDITEFLNDRPSNYRCPLENIVSLDYRGLIELCCCSDPDTENFYWKDIMEIKSVYDWQQYRQRMLACGTCQECRREGIGLVAMREY